MVGIKEKQNHSIDVILPITYSVSCNFRPHNPYQYKLVEYENPRTKSDVLKIPHRDSGMLATGDHVPADDYSSSSLERPT